MCIIDPGSENDKHALQLYTSKRRFINNEQRKPQPPERMRAARDQLLANCPEWRLRSLQSTYNCMGMVFASRRTWIDPAFFSLIAEDDGYRERCNLADAVEGDVAVYRKKSDGSILHVGVIVDVKRNLEKAVFSFEVLSQFGADGEYIHNNDKLPQWLNPSGDTSFSIWTEAVVHDSK